MGQGARIGTVRATNSARAGQVNSSNIVENISLVANENIAIGRMVALNTAGELFMAKSDADIAKICGISIEDGEAGNWESNLHKDNTNKPCAINVFGGAWVGAETSINIGASPFIRFATGTNGSVLGSVRNDSDGSTASINEEFTVRRMSQDGKSALIIQKSMLI